MIVVETFQMKILKFLVEVEKKKIFFPDIINGPWLWEFKVTQIYDGEMNHNSALVSKRTCTFQSLWHFSHTK